MGRFELLDDIGEICLAFSCCGIGPEGNDRFAIRSGVIGAAIRPAGTHAQHGGHSESGRRNSLEPHCCLLVNQTIICMTTTKQSLSYTGD